MDFESNQDLLVNYEISTSRNQKKFFPIALYMPWANGNFAHMEKCDHEVISRVWDLLKIRKIFSTFVVSTMENYYNTPFEIYSRNISGGNMKTDKISILPSPKRIYTFPSMCSAPPPELSAIDYTNKHIEFYSYHFADLLDDYYIENFIKDTDNIYTEFGYIKEPEQIFNALCKINCKINLDIKYLLINPITERDLQLICQTKGYSYIWDNTKFIISKSVPYNYIYTIPNIDNHQDLAYIVGLKNLLIADGSGNIYTDWDGGLVKDNYFARIKVRSNGDN